MVTMVISVPVVTMVSMDTVRLVTVLAGYQYFHGNCGHLGY